MSRTLTMRWVGLAMFLAGASIFAYVLAGGYTSGWFWLAPALTIAGVVVGVPGTNRTQAGQRMLVVGAALAILGFGGPFLLLAMNPGSAEATGILIILGALVAGFPGLALLLVGAFMAARARR